MKDVPGLDFSIFVVLVIYGTCSISFELLPRPFGIAPVPPPSPYVSSDCGYAASFPPAGRLHCSCAVSAVCRSSSPQMVILPFQVLLHRRPLCPVWSL